MTEQRASIRDVLMMLTEMRSSEIAELRRLALETRDAVVRQNGRLSKLEEREAEDRERIASLRCGDHEADLLVLQKQVEALTGNKSWVMDRVVAPLIASVIGAVVMGTIGLVAWAASQGWTP